MFELPWLLPSARLRAENMDKDTLSFTKLPIPRSGACRLRLQLRIPGISSRETQCFFQNIVLCIFILPRAMGTGNKVQPLPPFS